MAKPLQIHVKEDINELRQLLRQLGELLGKRIRMLIEIKRHQDQGGISKRALSEITGVNHNSIVKWRQMYMDGGIEALLTHGRIGFKPSIITPEEHEKLAAKLTDPTNGLQGYKELQRWIEEEFGKDIKYTTVYEYVKRHFDTKIKVARKSHIKKDEQAVEAFKKTSVDK